jgi:hypothetical protein
MGECSENKIQIKTQSQRELYRQSDSRLSMELVATFADRGSHAVSATDPYNRVPGFLDPSR